MKQRTWHLFRKMTWLSFVAMCQDGVAVATAPVLLTLQLARHKVTITWWHFMRRKRETYSNSHVLPQEALNIYKTYHDLLPATLKQHTHRFFALRCWQCSSQVHGRLSAQLLVCKLVLRSELLRRTEHGQKKTRRNCKLHVIHYNIKYCNINKDRGKCFGISYEARAYYPDSSSSEPSFPDQGERQSCKTNYKKYQEMKDTAVLKNV